MNTAIIGGIPLLILIIGALITRRILEPAVVSSIFAAILLYRQDFITGYISMMYAVLGNPSFQILVIVSIGFAGISALLEKIGAMTSFRSILERWCKSQRSTMFFTWLLGAIVFIDDYLNALAVSASMKGISDKMRIPREHLAYTVNCMGACVCVLLPFSSWAAFAIGCAQEQGLEVISYVKAIPFMFYPICAVIISLLLALGIFPKVGELKKSYARVAATGQVLADRTAGTSEKVSANTSVQTADTTSPAFFLVPIVALIAGMLVFEKDIIAGLLIALIVIFCMNVPTRRLSVKDFFDTFTGGAASMMPMIITIYITFITETCVEELGFTNFLATQMSRMVPAMVLPAVAFVSVGAITFFAASFWTLIVISFPIFLPMANVLQVPAFLIIAAVMSGVALGSQACLYSDAIFMVAMGTDVPNDTQFRTVLPYVLIGVIPAIILFLIAGAILC